MENAIFIIFLGICLIELVVIFALLNKKKPMYVATLIAITFGILGLIDTYQNRNLIFKHSENSQKEEVKYLCPNTINRAEDFPESFFDLKTTVAFEVLENDRCIITISKGIAITPGKKTNRYRLKIDESRNGQLLDYFICPYSEFNKALEVFYKKTQQKKGTMQIRQG